MTSTDLASKEVDTTTPRTKKAARALGYLSHDEWLRYHRAPREDACPLVVKGEEFYCAKDCEELFHPRVFLRQGRWPVPEAEPETYEHPHRRPASGHALQPLYRAADARPLPEKDEVLDAIRRVSREVDNYARPPSGADDDQSPLALVDRGISYAWAEGHLMFRGRCRNIWVYSDGLCDYRSTIIPDSVVRVRDLNVLELAEFRSEPPEWEAPSLEDARHVLRSVPPDGRNLPR
jgi:hypothetical protein